tara:strand:- start:21450 stop:22754 length:1305 start_codon:yes stop_codon:yes gene_type:complete
MADAVFEHSEYYLRQKRFIQQLPVDSLVILPNNVPSVRSNDTKYPYRANSYFLYLTGWGEASSILTISKTSTNVNVTLYVKPRNTESEIWEGRIVGVEDAKLGWPVDQAISISEFESELTTLIKNKKHLYLFEGINLKIDSVVSGQWAGDISDPKPHLDKMRSIKSPAEIEIMKSAVAIASEAHINAMSVTEPLIGEWEIQAKIENHFTCNRAQNSYNPIVGGGDNATILHYSSNSEKIDDSELVLVDAGCEVSGYASDITRTWPVNGKFTQPQREIYELVLKAQISAIQACKPGSAWDSMHRAASEVISRGLIELGILTCSYEEAMGKNLDGEYRKFFMHGTGHMLGLDVHDVGGGRQGGKPGPILSPGMIVTVEPGLYFASWREDIEIPSRYSGIGVRIEDDVLITESGPLVLSDGCPKTIDEIESIVGSGL